MSGVAVAPAGPALRAFIDTYRVNPWPPEHVFEWSGIRAGALYKAYTEAMQADDRAVLSSRDFGMTVQGMGFEVRRDPSGHTYPGMFQCSREEVARRIVTEDALSEELHRLWAEADEQHLATFDHGTTTVQLVTGDIVNGLPVGRPLFYPDGSPMTEERPNPCECDPQVMQAEHRERIAAAIEEHEQRLTEDGTIARLVEERFGAFLRWRDGDPDPNDASREAARVARQAEYDDIVARLAGDDLERQEEDALERRAGQLRDELYWDSLDRP